MAQQTANYQLTKPEPQDFVDIKVLNENFDAIDVVLKNHEALAESALPAASYTAADILAKLKTVDGAGSGLDADLFKGKSTVPISSGGTGATTAADARTNLGITPGNIGAAKSAEHNLKIYTTVTQLGFTAGEATIAGVYSALPSNSMFYGNASDFASGETPSAMGTVKMTKISATRGDITFFSKEVSVKDYRMFLLSNGGASGIWYQEYNSYNLGTAIQSLLQGGSISVVKSVQRGSYHYSNSSTDSSDGTENDRKYKDITINSINTSKAFLIVNSSAMMEGNNPYSPNGRIVNSTTIRVYMSNSYYNQYTNYQWQVVEYY